MEPVVKLWEASDYDDSDAEVSKKRDCAWGGSNTCQNRSEFTVVDRYGTNVASCTQHVGGYLLDRLRTP